MVWCLPLTPVENTWIRFLLSRELHRMKRPDISDGLEFAVFAMQGRQLCVSMPGAWEQRMASALGEAILNCGLAVESAHIC
jgi:hypothetical protein